MRVSKNIASSLIFACVVSLAQALSPPPPDNRNWDEAYRSFNNAETNTDRDGQRLLTLDRNQAVKVLLSALGRETPTLIRLRAIDTLGNGRVSESIDALVQIVTDSSEELRIRHYALNIGLRYQKDPKCLSLALEFVNARDAQMTPSAIWVMSEYKSPEAIAGLRKCFDFYPDKDLGSLIRALTLSGDPEASQFIWQKLQPTKETLSTDAFEACIYAFADQPISDAQAFMAPLVYSDVFELQYAAFRYFAAYPNDYVAQKLCLILKQKSKHLWGNPEVLAMIESYQNAESLSEETQTQLKQIAADYTPPRKKQNSLSSLFGAQQKP